MNGLFITLEGGEGSGKTTIAKNVVNKMSLAGVDVIYTREPGGNKIAEEIRSIILNPENTEMDSRTEALLYAAARRQHLVEKIYPALEAGDIVICDRFIDSSLVYQGHARGIGIEEVLKINKFAIDECMPQLTIFLDIEPEVGLERISANKGREINRLDLEEITFHEMVYKGYQNQVEQNPQRIKVVDASQSIEKVSQEVYELIMNELSK